MIEFLDGDILEDDATKFIPVNTVGVMEAGLALQAKQQVPEINNIYRYCLDHGHLEIGKPIFVLDNEYVLFPTKEHWKDPSELDWINQGLAYLVGMGMNGVETIALPKLGCGLGGLQWVDVLTLIYLYFGNSSEYNVRVYGEEIEHNQLFNI